MNVPEETFIERESNIVFVGFALTECDVQVNVEAVKYLRAIHGTALELAIQNHFGSEIGGFWLTAEQVARLKSLSDYYPPSERTFVSETIEAYLQGQLKSFDEAFLQVLLECNKSRVSAAV